MRAVVAVAALLIATPAAAVAQTAPDPASVSGPAAAPAPAVAAAPALPPASVMGAPDTPEVRAAIDQLLDATGFARNLDNARRDFVEQTKVQLRNQLAERGAVISERYYTQIGQALDSAFARNQPAFRDGLVKVYRENFSEDELKAMAAFYRTELGQMMLTRMPRITGLINQSTQQALQGLRTTAQPQVQAILDDALRGRQLQPTPR